MSATSPGKHQLRQQSGGVGDSYRTFGCESGEPTFRFSLVDGVKGGYLVNPVMIDARTEITTQLLSEKGYAMAVTHTKNFEYNSKNGLATPFLVTPEALNTKEKYHDFL